MKRKLISNTYLKDVLKYKIYIERNTMLNAYVCVKKIEEIAEPSYFYHENEKNCIIDNGYYILEYVPLNLNYTVRGFLNNNKEIVEWYIDISHKNGEIDAIPFYDDLYLDILIYGENIILIDQDELDNALDENVITRDDYDLAYFTANNLMEELRRNKNKFINRNNKDLLLLLEKMKNISD